MCIWPICEQQPVIHRYLVANGGYVRKAAKGLTQTLQWRAAQSPGCIRWRDVQHCSSGGRLELLPDLDLQGRPVLLHRLRCALQSCMHACSAQCHPRTWHQWLLVCNMPSDIGLCACRCPSPPLTDEKHIMAWVHVLEAACHMADTGACLQMAAS